MLCKHAERLRPEVRPSLRVPSDSVTPELKANRAVGAHKYARSLGTPHLGGGKSRHDSDAVQRAATAVRGHVKDFTGAAGRKAAA